MNYKEQFEKETEYRSIVILNQKITYWKGKMETTRAHYYWAKSEWLEAKLKAQIKAATEYSRQVLELEEYIAQINHQDKLMDDLDKWRKGKSNPYKVNP